MKQAIFTKSLTISMPPEQYAQIKEITDQSRVSMGEWVRGAVDVALEKLKEDNENGFDKNRKGNELTVNPSDQYAQD